MAVEPDLGNLMSESFADLFEESLNELDMKQGSIVTGTVVDIDSDWVIVNAGLKSEAVIPRVQFLDDKGFLSKEMMPDGTHPSERAHEIWAEAIMPELKKMLGK